MKILARISNDKYVVPCQDGSQNIGWLISEILKRRQDDNIVHDCYQVNAKLRLRNANGGILHKNDTIVDVLTNDEEVILDQGEQNVEDEPLKHIVDGSKAAKPYIDKIYQDVGNDWINLAMALSVENRDIKKIQKENSDIHHQCHTMLHGYARKYASSFTKSMLIEALVNCGHNTTVDKIAPMSLGEQK